MFSKIIIKLSALTPILIIFLLMTLLVISYFKFGYLPQYGIDADPHTVFSNGFIKFINLSLFVSFYLLFFSFLSLIILIIAKYRKIPQLYICAYIGLYIIGFILLVLLKESATFKWLVD